ncbi:hypothetical protein NGM10_00080 [Halorussus salilacus]|uniref:hypothetical protein n=1 Tax=Halorussus salilacus TaxID=2953750 RepID=UPI0020A22927|nr:hypothetical protein [Halorussus salilacus]USZ68156.1 hypothetical protein NGM10_00080 [Halorussus salilacus]
MDWWKPLAALTVACVAFVAVGGTVRLVRAAVTSPAALAVAAMLVFAVLAVTQWGARPPRWLSTPYW